MLRTQSRELILRQGCQIAEKSSKIVPLGAPSSSISLNRNELEKLAVTQLHCEENRWSDFQRTERHVIFSPFSGFS
jgi:hypothetical protein